MDICRRLLPTMVFLAAANHAAIGITATEHVPFPKFSAEPMTLEQCQAQFTDNCEAPLASIADCPMSQNLQISCNNTASATEIQRMAKALSQTPLKPVLVMLYDGHQIFSDNFAAVRRQVVMFQIFNCTSNRVTGKLPSLKFANLLEFGPVNCYDLVIQRSDFWQSTQLRIIELINSTIAILERDTFTDLPALRMLSLESYLNAMEVFPDEMREYLKRLHCGCEYTWFRQWWSGNKNLLQQANEGDIYTIGLESNVPRNKSDVYLPVDCAADPFPVGNASIDFTQERYSINEDFYQDKGHQNCTAEDMDPDDSFPDFVTEPMNSVEAAVRLLGLCDPAWHAESLNDTNYSYVMLDICNNSQTMFYQLRQQAQKIAKLRPRQIQIQFKETTPLTFEHMSPIRKEIVVCYLMECSTSRATRMLPTYRLTNLLQYIVFGGKDLDVKTSDFQFSRKLRMISFVVSTIRTLEEATFTNLPALKALTLESGLHMTTVVPEYGPDMREYLRRLHCSCEFAWFRRWRMNSTSLLQSTNDNTVTRVFRLPGFSPGFVNNQTHQYVPIDCAAAIPSGPEHVNVKQVEYSLNVDNC
ncbi:uncharacterized protein LOC129589999 [Paramacrobiotus metropolitanus]|uniref:uncharacterized protein LOC129589999 n=1 Tax=Paramacrobiotus metropolitanus TaxID=2943436 RepID=UPI00244607DF|nr:uncharacterized protein LOC129589999 [Paramacrobiotus metropolitanus]